MQLQENGSPPGACGEQQQRHLLQQLHDSETKYRFASEELQTLRTQQAKEMEEVKPYVLLDFFIFIFFFLVYSPHLWS